MTTSKVPISVTLYVCQKCGTMSNEKGTCIDCDLRMDPFTYVNPSAVDDITDLYFSAQDEFKNTRGDYWQGRKDGLRLALALLEPNHLWDKLNSSSPGFQVTEREWYRNVLKDIYMNVCAAMDDVNRKVPIHIQTKVNIWQWCSLYEMAAKEGKVEPAPNALNPYPPNGHWR